MKNRKQNVSIFRERDGSDSAGKIDKWFNQHEKLCIAILVIIVVGLLAVSPFIPDNGHKTVKSELTKAGYDVDGIAFVLIENDGFASKRIYQSSEPIEYAAGIFVEQWELTSYSFGSSITRYSVKPYPEPPSTILVNLRLTITQEDYELLSKQAGVQEVEEYIKQLIYNSLKDQNNNAP